MENKENKKSVKFNLISKEYKTKEGKSFYAYKCATKNGKLMTCKFVKELSSYAPQKEGIYNVVCPIDGVSISTSKQYPETWIRKITSITENKVTANIDQIADTFEISDDDLPF